MQEAGSEVCHAKPSHSQLLDGVRICLVFPYSLSHYTRLLEEIAVLEHAGAAVGLLTSSTGAVDAPASIEVTVAPLGLDEEYVATRLMLSTDGFVERLKDVGRWLRNVLHARRDARERAVILRTIAQRVDIMWVIDEPLLPAVMTAAGGRRAAVVYETVDLVPEYRYLGEDLRRRRLDEERRLVGHVNGFITACDGYADYYMQLYSGAGLSRRPIIRDNMPARIVDSIRPTVAPLRLIFLGSLMHDRPVLELIEAMSLATPGATLTFQGKNHLGDAPERMIAEHGLDGRLSILEPCPPDSIVDIASEYDVGVVALRGENENELWASTSKIFTYMSAGLAILGSNLPGIARVVSEHANGLLVEGMDPAEWAAAVDAFAAMASEDIDDMKQRSLEAARLHSWERQESAFVGEFVRALRSVD